MSNHLPVIFISLGIVSIITTELIRHHSWQKRQASGFAPGTQHIAMLGTFITVAAFLAALISWLFLK